ncbi:ferric siderophore transport system, periplasmic binding protein TonB [Aquitalea magnusonii]|uniref:Ferric siderophore transport system, periplasmic binding protein TonB n=1 Tax=Aquitalea magnusonii TaxID=332411 RepID=A0A3G9GD99_9NEIS|nr:ferric siderophore transport system, periplasmic binding protein TonB [Aquitalea magnusonii]
MPVIEPAARCKPERTVIVLVVVLLHGGLASWLASLAQMPPARTLATSIAVQWLPAQPVPLPAVAKSAAAMPQQPSHQPRHQAAAKSAPVRPAPVTPQPSSPPLAQAVQTIRATDAMATHQAASVAAPSPSPVEAHSPVSTEPGFSADYLHNPAPAYPAAARRNGEEGKVLLRVHVSAQGQAETVEIHRSSGFIRLDEAARETVANWRFTPARRGAVAIASSVIVPITFRLGHA